MPPPARESSEHHAPGMAPTSGIPESHRDLVDCPPVAALTTVMPDGQPQTSVVWCDFDGTCVRVNTMSGFRKERNMRRNPHVTLLCYDPRRPLRYLEVRGTVIEMSTQGGLEHLDALSSKYAGRPVRYFGDMIPADFAETEVPVLCRVLPRYYGYVYPDEQRERETRVICRIHPKRIVLDAIHGPEP